jgi:hypothetical protein
MYCPRCAAQNPDAIKFCRACGTNLETVALALAGGQPSPATPDTGQSEATKPAKTWREKRREGVSSLVQGSGFLVASLVIGVALGVFSNQADWIYIWVGLAGWMACWGIISLALGVNALLESNSMFSQLGDTAESRTDLTTAQLLSSADDPKMLQEATAAHGFMPPLSVTDQTTEPLVKQPRQKSKRAG